MNQKRETVKIPLCETSKESSCMQFNHRTRGCDAEKKALVEIPAKLLEEMRILGRHTCYVLYAEKPSDTMRVDGYTRISQSSYLCYEVDEIKRLTMAGRIPVLVLQRTDQTRPTMKQVFTWWVTDNVLGYPVTHGLLSMAKGNVELKLFNLKECFFCAKKSKPIKNLVVE